MNKNGALAKKHLALAEKIVALANRNAALASRTLALAKKNGALAGRTLALAGKNGALAEFAAWIWPTRSGAWKLASYEVAGNVSAIWVRPERTMDFRCPFRTDFVGA